MLKRLFLFAFVCALCFAPAAGATQVATPFYLQVELDNLAQVPSGTWFVISKENHKLFVLQGKKIIDEYGVAVARNRGNKQKVGDNKTPEGMFEVQQIQNASSWAHDFRDGKGMIPGAYGPWFIRLKTGWQGIGIHGTHNPDSIGTDATEGCIRLRNPEVAQLKEKYARVGMKVLILK